MKYLILGASSGLGRELAYLLAKKSNDLIIISRDERDLKAIKSDLEIQFNIAVQYFELDLSIFKNIQNFFNSNLNITDDVDGILLPVGMIMSNDHITNDMGSSNGILQANLGCVIYFISKFFPIFLKKNSGLIVGFGSIAGIFGREENVTYSAAKKGLVSFFESLAISSISTNLRIQFYITGYLDTNLSYGKNLIFPKGSIKNFVNIIYNNFNINFNKFYYPYWWLYISVIFNIIPFFVLKKFYKLFKEIKR
jgi:short-subunit dehydrogenase